MTGSDYNDVTGWCHWWRRWDAWWRWTSLAVAVESSLIPARLHVYHLLRISRLRELTCDRIDAAVKCKECRSTPPQDQKQICPGEKNQLCLFSGPSKELNWPELTSAVLICFVAFVSSSVCDVLTIENLYLENSSLVSGTSSEFSRQIRIIRVIGSIAKCFRGWSCLRLKGNHVNINVMRHTLLYEFVFDFTWFDLMHFNWLSECTRLAKMEV